MRKLKLQVQLSVDGYVAGPAGEMDWMTWNWDEELKKFVNDLTSTVDCIVMGSNLAKGFIPHWARVAANPNDAEYAFGKIMHETPKVVFSTQMKQSNLDAEGWSNTTLNNANLQTGINGLKSQSRSLSGGKDIIVYGGATFVSNLIDQNLIDEFYLFINPSAIGKGMKIFNGRTNLKLEKALPFSCGITVMKYQPSKAN